MELMTKAEQLTRAETDRELREYRKLAAVLRSSANAGNGSVPGGASLGETEREGMDETAMLSRMYALRALVLSVEDVQERLLLYDYYIKGMTLERCAKALGVSKRTVYRLKLRALESAARRMGEK